MRVNVLFYFTAPVAPPPLTANSEHTTIVLYNYDHFSYPICIRIVKLYLVVFRKNMNMIRKKFNMRLYMSRMG